MRLHLFAIAAASSLALAACSSSKATTSGQGGGGGTPVDDSPIGGDRPVTVYVPRSYDPAVPTPLVMLLHGYSADGEVEELYLQFQPVAAARGFLYLYPDGTVDKMGYHFWNATDACCNLYGADVDDSAYLSSLIDQAKARFNVDPKRVYLIGHSNGGFMSYRMACDHADQIAAIASLAGAMWEDTSKCKPSGPVSVLEMHGTADNEVDYGGSSIAGNTYPSAPQTVKDWATFDGCSLTPDTSAPNLDLEASIPGAETTVTQYDKGCKPGGYAELWTIQGAGHIPSFTASFQPDVIDFLFAHPKP
jgi:polyhydroxybutyrate depolymerase